MGDSVRWRTSGVIRPVGRDARIQWWFDVVVMGRRIAEGSNAHVRKGRRS